MDVCELDLVTGWVLTQRCVAAMVWTAEFSSVCSPPWCYDELLGRAMAGEELSVEEMNNCVCDGRADPSGGGHGRRRRRLLGLDPNASKSENKQ